MNLWDLPVAYSIGGVAYPIHADFRDVLNIIKHLEEPGTPDWLRWRTAVALFYEGRIPDEHAREAMEKLAEFLAYEKTRDKPGPKLLDWEQDASAIVAGVNKVSGKEIRSLPFLHWWTFLSYFYEIGEGQLQTIVSIRDKIKRGKKLEKWEQEYYTANRSKVDLQEKYTDAEKKQLEDIRNWINS